MIEQTQQEVAEAMAEDPKLWAAQYIDLMDMCCELEKKYNELVLAVLPANPKNH